MELTPGYKQTQVGVIPATWRLRPILKALQIANGQVDPRVDPYKSMTLVAPDHIESETGRLLTKQTASEQRAISGKYLFARGDVVYSKIRPYLRKAVLADFDGLCSADMYPLKPAPNVSGSFMLAVLLGHRFTKYAESVSVRSGIPKINRAELADFLVALPPPCEQHTIAAALSDVDALLEGLDRLIAKKRDLKNAAMQQLLTGRTRLPGFHGEWETKRLGCIAEIRRGASPRPIKSPVWFDENSEIGWVRISDVTRSGMYLLQTAQRLSFLGVQHSRPVSSGSLIMSICATVGRPIITSIDVCIHDGFVVLDDLQANQKFVYYVLRSIESEWSSYGQTGSQMNLNTDLIRETKVFVPPTAEQAAIANVLCDMDAEIVALENRRAKTQDLKEAMMQELLTGKTRLVEPEPAHV